MNDSLVTDRDVIAQLRAERRLKHPAAIAVDSTLPLTILDRHMPGQNRTVREYLAECASIAVIEALATIPAHVVDDGREPAGPTDAELFLVP